MSTWLARNDFRALRFGFAIALFLTVVIPLAQKGRDLISHDHHDLVQRTYTMTEPTFQTPIEGLGNNDSEAKEEKPVKTRELIATRTENEILSASPRVWVYGLQLAAWLGALCISMWALVMLCKDE